MRKLLYVMGKKHVENFHEGQRLNVHLCECNAYRLQMLQQLLMYLTWLFFFPISMHSDDSLKC